MVGSAAVSLALDSTFHLVIVVLAVARVTRLITVDYLLDSPRRWVQRHAPEKIAYLVGCPWCTGVWVSTLIVVAVVHAPTNRLLVVGCYVAAVAHLVGLISLLEPPEQFGAADDEIEASG